MQWSVDTCYDISGTELTAEMPERVHIRLDAESAPLGTAVRKNAPLSTHDISSKSKKRKREHVDLSSLEGHAKPLETGRRSLPVHKEAGYIRHLEPDDGQDQQLNGYHGVEPATLTKSKTKVLSKDPLRPANDSHRLKSRAKILESSRKTLPIWSYATIIREALCAKDVMLLVGETGSGKSTQVPQMLVDEPWCKPQIVPIDGSSRTVTVGGCIAITEPRRVAAITLARRVAEEMGSPLGSSSPASKVGYSVRFDNSTSPSTRIKFLTEGMLLQEMLRDPWLKAYSAVLVDEVHERGVNVDLVLGFLRGMIAGKNEGRGGVPLKVRFPPKSDGFFA